MFRNRLTLAIASAMVLLPMSAYAQEATATPAPVSDAAQPAATNDPNETAVPAGFSERYPRYRIGSGDSFDVTFTYSPEFNQTLTVQPDGFVSLREVGDIHVLGKTVAEVTHAITQAYSTTLREPKVTVLLKDFEKPYFIFNGDVKNPGKYELRGKTTVTAAVALAGGFLHSAKHSEVYLFRREGAEAVSVKKLNVKAMLKSASEEDIVLQPGDMLYVPQSVTSKIGGIVVPRVVLGPSIH